MRPEVRSHRLTVYCCAQNDSVVLLISDNCFFLCVLYRRLLRAMGGMTPEDRCKVPIRYKELYKISLYDKVKSECGNSDVSAFAHRHALLFW